MKNCAYCGCENEDAAMQCRECGTDEFKPDKSLAIPIDAPVLPEVETPAVWSLDFSPLTASDMEQDWVTLVTCAKLYEADALAALLDSSDIPVFLPDQYLMQAIGFNLNTYGFVRVQVPPQQYAAARELLASAERLLPPPLPSSVTPS